MYRGYRAYSKGQYGPLWKESMIFDSGETDEERKSPREAKKNKEARRMDKKPKKSQTQYQPRARALKMARPRPPFLNMEVSVGGAPARPRWHARATLFRNDQDKDLARPRNGVGAPARQRQIHLNEGYFGDFTFPGHGPSIFQAQFDLYGGGTAEAQHTFSHFINFSLSLVFGDFWRSSPSLSFSL
ncbi:hypothetical protein PIB30_055647 [Stylosanthes scabra]|uniref:Uncharacterized protein n=1 Tax=Stylosanthes scabra TaxID=79078 RepID=A0ABU6UMN9_9FABA|nr:hypothetical protein [Stylosanthes scabra]